MSQRQPPPGVSAVGPPSGGGGAGGVLVGEEAGEGLPEAADGLGLGLVLAGGAPQGLPHAEGIGERLRFTAGGERPGLHFRNPKNPLATFILPHVNTLQT